MTDTTEHSVTRSTAGRAWRATCSCGWATTARSREDLAALSWSHKLRPTLTVTRIPPAPSPRRDARRASGRVCGYTWRGATCTAPAGPHDCATRTARDRALRDIEGWLYRPGSDEAD